ncbi:MAG: hypothetical protein PF505_06795 [Vallitaleaceae bacterium]|jgi:carbon monoxide dehydrogenase subunit G|nr:hypothetical protein [Vallitaleaceae bacterium]
MTTYESDIKTISANNEMVFAKLTDLTNLEQFKDKIPADANISDIECDTESVHLNVSPIGKIGLRIVEKEEFKTIKFAADQSPIEFNIWIQLVPSTDSETKLKATLKAELPAMIKMMMGNKMQDIVNQVATALTKLDY